MTIDKIYKGQHYRLKLNCGTEIAGATTIKIRYLKPGALIYAEWTATIEDPTLGLIYKDITPTENNTAGEWRVWSYLIIANKTYIGEPGVYNVLEEGTQ